MAKLETDHCRHVEQVDWTSCIRCNRVAVSAFVFDDGTFYCKTCFDFMLGGDVNA